ncbi:hypothetical protein [Nocardioides sp. T2.26MG-1]|uniref:hypothetical protein n=1 Tax=Nocardioides sp. T2.26MG-1 TaxID=3041166 RepID=UPI00247795C7|nr:hypothetical protein [Nocardioides sp. T2.26MG-1]CAI9414328.1 hypothetical protein HIDPHFAB_02242 [Nocardioides sp. T2.26MG-1]
MQRLIAHRRGRALASLITAGLGLAAVTGVTGTAQAADPAGDCATPYPIADLAGGQPVTGLTVSHGTTPDGFTGEVLGVLDDGIAPDIDMVMVRLTSPEIDRVGIWQGMSGSPVYAADGRLIGAVAYGLAMGASPVAGVTPFADMDDYLGNVARRVTVDQAAARTIARHTDVSAADAAEGFRQLPAPLGVAGVGARQLELAADHAGKRTYLPRSAYAVGRASGQAAGPETVVAGGNLAASLAYGDITMAAIGTATSVCDGRVVGFGHPLDHLGATTLTLHPADAIYVQEDLIAGFKLANLGAPAGTISQDRLTGISGLLGPIPSTSDVTSTVTDGDRSREGTSHVSVRTPDALASTTFYEFLANHDRVVDGTVDGSEVASWTVTGTGPDGTPFTLSSSNRYVSEWDLTYEVGFALGDTVYYLAGIPGVTITGVTTGVTVEDAAAAYRISALQRKVDGTWTAVTRRQSIPVRAGKTLTMRAVLSGGGLHTTVPISVRIPRSMAGTPGILEVTGGQYLGGLGPMATIEQAKKAVANLVRNDQLKVSLMSLSKRGRGTPVSSQVLGPVDGVVSGNRSAQLMVR